MSSDLVPYVQKIWEKALGRPDVLLGQTAGGEIYGPTTATGRKLYEADYKDALSKSKLSAHFILEHAQQMRDLFDLLEDAQKFIDTSKDEVQIRLSKIGAMALIERYEFLTRNITDEDSSEDDIRYCYEHMAKLMVAEKPKIHLTSLGI